MNTVGVHESSFLPDTFDIIIPIELSKFVCSNVTLSCLEDLCNVKYRACVILLRALSSSRNITAIWYAIGYVHI